MSYELYVGENCHDCQLVHKAIIELGIKVEIKNLDKGAEAPMDLFILPALLTTNGDLKAYGIDIIDYLKRTQNEMPKKSGWKRFLGL